MEGRLQDYDYTIQVMSDSEAKPDRLKPFFYVESPTTGYLIADN